ncbi:hypothetical protein Zmor_012456 [Zophobas morio]|uniref:Uncharacterized protein n=1 Tax=Zophobas morio TaxID=2755281 RepID=A0AA38IBI4_9CUCU|nr:hypothetical protein Zmor_012456 [Zophobas morio]
MSVEVRVEEWLRKMGYNGGIPASLPKICNPSTAFIWEQLISNVRHRQEVDHIKKTVIVNRLSKKPLEEQDQFSYPIKEIQIYMERQRLEKHIKNLERHIAEKRDTVDDILRKNKVTYMKIENIKAKIRENQERKFLLDKKSKVIEKDIEHGQEVLTMARNLTPVEMEASANPDEITKTLQKCAEKLQKLSDGVSVPQSNKTKSVSTSLIRTVKKPTYSNCNAFSRFLNQSTILSDIAPTTCKKMNYKNKENINFTQHSTAISRCLKFSDTGSEKSITNDETEKTLKRESLGILSNECLDISDDLDNFLLSRSNVGDVFLQPLTDSLLEPPTKDVKDEILDKLRNDKNIEQILKDLLHENNRYLIMTQWENIYEQLLKDLSISIIDCNKLVGSKRSIRQSDLSEMYFIHLKNELEKDKCRILLKTKQEAVKRKKEEICMGSRRRNSDEMRTILESQIEEVYLNGGNNFLRKEIDSAKTFESDIDIQAMNLRIKQLQEDIIEKVRDIQTFIPIIYKVLKDIQNNQTETSHCVKKLSPYFHEINWAGKMTQSVNSREVEVFREVPLEFNRKFKYSQLQVYHKIISDTVIPSYVTFDSENLNLLTRLIKTPFSPTESVIFDALQMKVLSNKLRLTNPSTECLDLDYQKFSLGELEKQEEYVQPVIEKLDSIINSDLVKGVLSAPNRMKELGDLWLEMPFRKYISENRQVDGYGYKYYEKVLGAFKTE